MLDNEEAVDLDVIEAEGGEEIEAEEEQPDLVIAIDGEEAEQEPDDEGLGPRGKTALAALRKAQKEAAAEARAAKAELAELKAASAPKVEAIERPTLEGCGFDADLLEKKLEAYVVAQAEVKAKAAQREADLKAQDDDYQARLGRYTTGKAAMRVDDYEAAEETVRATLTREQQSVLIRNSDDAAKVVFALGKSKKALADLAAVKDIDRFAYQLAKLEGKITVTSKAPPPPETKLRASGGSGGIVAAQGLDKLYDAASKSGDYTAYFAEKRRREGLARK